MSNPHESEVLVPRVQADELVNALIRKGFDAVRLTTPDHDRHPCIRVVSDKTNHLATPSYYYIASDDDEDFWIWDEALDPVSPAEYIEVAAEIIDAQMKLRRLRMPRVHVM